NDEFDNNIEAITQRLTLSYKELLLVCLRTPLDKQAGITIEEMERSLEVIGQIKALPEEDVLELDDEQHRFLLLKLAQVRYTAFDPRFVQFSHDLKQAGSQVPPEVSPNGHLSPALATT